MRSRAPAPVPLPVDSGGPQSASMQAWGGARLHLGRAAEVRAGGLIGAKVSSMTACGAYTGLEAERVNAHPPGLPVTRLLLPLTGRVLRKKSRESPPLYCGWQVKNLRTHGLRVAS